MAAIERRSFIGTLLAALSAASVGDRVFADSTRGGFKVAADEDRFGKARSIGLSSTAFKVATEDTRGALFLMEQRSTKPGGPPLHLHHGQDEFWYVMAGDYMFQVGSDHYQAHAGDCLLGPREIPHAWAFIGSSPGRLLVGFTPANIIQEYFERPRTPGVYLTDAATYHAYGMELLGPPLSLQ
jgi:mannose-6-phosphate isomerase-like protein (cupin superfamily)